MIPNNNAIGAIDTTSDEFYSTQESRLNTILGDESKIWEKIGAARRQHAAEHGLNTSHTNDVFNLWLLDTHGIKLSYTDGMINLELVIENEQKYLLFLLRY